MIDISLNIFLGPWISADKVQYSLFVFSSFWSLLRNLDDSYYEWSFTNVIQLCRLLWIHYEWGFYPSSECCDGGRINCLGGWNTYYVLINSWGIRFSILVKVAWHLQESSQFNFPDFFPTTLGLSHETYECRNSANYLVCDFCCFSIFAFDRHLVLGVYRWNDVFFPRPSRIFRIGLKCWTFHI